jgi:light-regulated signal transduction histidine kinase (bacteriophytochrome)
VAIYSQLLQRRYASNLDGKASEYLGYCIEGAQRVENLIHDLLSYSQTARNSGNLAEVVDLNEVLESVKTNLDASIRDTGAVITSTTLPMIRGDRVPLSHLMQNLLSNALKYRSAAQPRIDITAEPDGGFWRVAVRDNGIGIPKTFQDQIFGLFKRLHDRNEYPGTGIGLAICQKVIDRYGGRIWVESEEGQGSTFFFTVQNLGNQ